MSNPLLVGSAFRWRGTTSSHMVPVRINQGLFAGDVGLVLEQNVTELYVLIKGRFEYFQIGEVEVISESR